MKKEWTARDYLDDIATLRTEQDEFWRDEARAAQEDDGYDYYAPGR